MFTDTFKVFLVGWITPIAAVPPQHYDARMWIAYTVAGAIMASGLAFLLKTKKDSGRVLLGRSIGALIGGVLGSRLLAAYYPPVMEWSSDPIFLSGLGVGLGLLGYLISLPLINMLDKLSPTMAQWVINAVPRAFSGALKGFIGEKKDDPKPPVQGPPAPPSPGRRRRED